MLAQQETIVIAKTQFRCNKGLRKQTKKLVSS